MDLWRAHQHDGSTISEITRTLCRVDTPEGAALFQSAVELFARHILK